MTAPDQSRTDQSWEVSDCFFDLIGHILTQAEQLAQRMAVPAPFIKVLHILDHPMAMKELGKRMHCDPSFVTLIADMLEKRGLARREPHPADRRVKNLVLTDEGLGLKRRIESEISARMPWNRALTDAERAELLALIRKMLATEPDEPDATGAGEDDRGTADGTERNPEHPPLATSSGFTPTPTGEVNGVLSDTAAG